MSGIRHSWRDAQRILCVRLDNMGDVLMATPAIAALKHGLPGPDGERRERHVTLWASESGAAIARHVPEIDAVIAYDAPWVAAGREQPLQERAFTRLAAHRFDAAVIFTTYSQSALPAATLLALAGVPLVLAHVRENPYALVSHWVRETEPDPIVRHEVERQLALVATVGAVPPTPRPRLSLDVTDDARRRLERTLAVRGVEGSYAIVHPGATAPSRRWPAERFAQVGARLAVDEGLQVLVSGGIDERDLTRSVTAQALALDAGAAGRVHDIGGALALDELIAAIADASVLVSNNSGPVHVAAAVGTPVVDLYALTNPQHTPWAVECRVLSHDVPCRNCYRSVCPEPHHGCLEGVPADAAFDAAREIARRPTDDASTLDSFAAVLRASDVRIALSC